MVDTDFPSAIGRVDLPDQTGPAAVARPPEPDTDPGVLPRDPFRGFLLEQVGVTATRLERCGRTDRRIRERAVFRARTSWDEDKAVEAEELGAKIGRSPAVVAARLRATPHGCDWLIRRWEWLAQAAERSPAWTPGQIGLAHDLLGIPAEGRDGGELASGAARSALALREIEGLRRGKVELLPGDAADRAMTAADCALEPSAEHRRLARYEGSLRGWIRWLVGQLGQIPPSPTDRSVREPARAVPEPRPARIAPPPARESTPAPARPATACIKADDRLPSAFLAAPARVEPAARRDPRALREAARREAKLRKKGRRARS